ncbi:MAG TPA: preprotein translocase subunit SecG [Candidatus Omnitrophota bacterium]|nr:preprotein translocase subunit SecG [Candidatus Omnitrophota bacterium]
MTFIIILHVLVCLLLSMIILMQSGRGGGLTETFASAESVFGAKTNSLMVRATTVLASIFLVTCLVLTYLSSRKERSLMSNSSLIKKESVEPKGIPVEKINLNPLKNDNPVATNSVQ